MAGNLQDHLSGLRDALLKDLSRLIRSLEIYLYSFVPGKMVKIVGAIRSCL